MQGNDIGDFVVSTIAVMFEGLIDPGMPKEPIAERKSFFRRKVVDYEDLTLDQVVRRWRPLEMPIKSLIHLTEQLHQHVEVYTFYPAEYVESIERWLFRKGVSVPVYSYEDLDALRDDFRLNRDVHTLYTPFEYDAQLLGPRATVMGSASTWGF